MTAPGISDPNPLPNLPPLKPRPVLFVVLAIVLVIWIGVLVFMRLKTVGRPVFTPPTTEPASRPA